MDQCLPKPAFNNIVAYNRSHVYSHKIMLAVKNVHVCKVSTKLWNKLTLMQKSRYSNQHKCNEDIEKCN